MMLVPAVEIHGKGAGSPRPLESAVVDDLVTAMDLKCPYYSDVAFAVAGRRLLPKMAAAVVGCSGSGDFVAFAPDLLDIAGENSWLARHDK